MAGKLWWPYQATIDDATSAVSAFHERMADRGWLPERTPIRPVQIGITDLVFEGNHWPDVNDFLQIERDPDSGKTQARQSLALLLSQMAKWHMGLRPESRWLDIPRVLAVPARDGSWQHTLMGRLSGVPGLTGAAGLPLTLTLSEHEALPEPVGTIGRGKVWGAAAGGDSTRWVQAAAWRRQRQSAAFAKMIWASAAERSTWLASDAVRDNPRAQGLILLDVNGAAQREAAKQVGAIWVTTLKRWAIGEYWDTWPSQQWIRGADARAAKLPEWKRPGQGQNYGSWKQQPPAARPPVPEDPTADD